VTDHFESAADVRSYALAGRATLTLTSQRTGACYTYKIIRASGADWDGSPKNLWSVGLLTGPDNETDYDYVGLINGVFKTTAKTKLPDDATPIRAFRYFWQHVEVGEMPPEVTVQHCGHCGRCGRKLTAPESITHGLGPECAGKM
jgi:Family of unknown function (DUF6011)